MLGKQHQPNKIVNMEVEVLEGISEGDLVVIHGLQLAREGQEVRLLGVADDSTNIRSLLEADR